MIDVPKYLHKMKIFGQLDILSSEFSIDIYLNKIDSNTKFRDYALANNFDSEIVDEYIKSRVDKCKK